MQLTLTQQAIAERVRAVLAMRRISGAELARRMGVTQAYVARRTRGAVAWSTADLHDVASVLGVEVSVLLAGPIASLSAT